MSKTKSTAAAYKCVSTKNNLNLLLLSFKFQRPLKTGENPPANSKSSNEICESMGAKLPFIGTKQKATAISKFAKGR